MAKSGVEYLNSRSKRRFDVLGALALGVPAALAVLPVSVVSAIDNESLNTFFVQERLGQFDEPVEIVKFRTLPEELTETDDTLYGPHDPRASQTGTLLRKYGLDEIPQLLNVLRGDLLLIGMRAALPGYKTMLKESDPVLFDEWDHYYHSAKPALISAAKSYNRGHIEQTNDILQEVMRLEISYVKNASLANDIRTFASLPRNLINANRQSANVADQYSAA